MKKKILSILKTFIPLIIGAIFIFIFFRNTSAQDRLDILNAIKKANFNFIYLSLFLGALSHLSRAYRWNYMLKSLQYNPKLITNIMAILIGYLVNLGIPRSGEIFRATIMATYAKIPFEKSFGTILVERTIDVIMLLLICGLAFFLEYDLLIKFFQKKEGNPIFIILSILILGLLFFVFLRWAKKSNTSIAIKILKKLKGIWEGIIIVFKMKKKGYYLLHTLFIWAMYILMFYVIKYSFPETQGLDFNPMLLGFIAGALSVSTTNGGIGVYPIAVSLVLMNYGISKEISLAFGWVMWSGQTILIVVFGAISFLVLPFYKQNKKLNFSFK